MWSSARAGTEFPVGTLVINVSGSLVLGILTGSALHHGVSAPWLTVAGTGLIGAYTTFSTFTFDAVRLAEADRWRLAAAQRGAQHRPRSGGGGPRPGRWGRPSEPGPDPLTREDR